MFGFHVSSHAALPRCCWSLQRQSAVARVPTATRRETEGEMIPPPHPHPTPPLLCEYEHHGSNYNSEIKQASPLLVISLAPMKIKMTADTLRCLHGYAVLRTRCWCSSLRFPRNIAQHEGEVDRSKPNVDVMFITPHVNWHSEGVCR